jgi:hypothetical protein
VDVEDLDELLVLGDGQPATVGAQRHVVDEAA